MTKDAKRNRMIKKVPAFSQKILTRANIFVNHYSYRAGNTSTPVIGNLYLDPPRQNGYIVVRSLNFTIYRDNAFANQGGILLSCFVKKTTAGNWKLIHQKRWDIQQFPMGKSELGKFTFLHEIGTTCETGTYSMRCGLAGIEKASDTALQRAAALIQSCVHKEGLVNDLCSVEVSQQSYTCTESEHSYSRSQRLPVSPRSVLQFQKISLSAGNLSTPGTYVNSEADVRDILGHITNSATVSNLNLLPKVFVDVALGRPGRSSLSSTLRDPLVSSRGPVEDVEDTSKRQKEFMSSSSQGGWWSVDLLSKPYQPGFKDFDIIVDLNSSLTRPEKLQVMMTTSFSPINLVSSSSAFFTCFLHLL